MESDKKILVIAGNIDEFKEWCRENNISLNGARYISSPDHLRGLRNAKVVKYGAYWKNRIYKWLSEAQVEGLIKSAESKK